MSFIIWGGTFIFVILWYIALRDLVQRSLANADGLFSIAQFNFRVALIGVGCAVVNGAGLGLGVSGLMQANRKRHFSVFGVALNVWGIMIALGFISPFIAGGLSLLIVIATGIWVFFDAERIGVRKTDEKSSATESRSFRLTPNMGPIGWALSSWLLWVIAFPIYLINRPEFQRKFQLEKQIQTRDVQPPELPVAPVPTADVRDMEQQLRKLAALKDEGIISPDEFDQKKKALLGL